MKKIRNLILIISFIPCILSSQSSMMTPQQKDNRNHSKQLIERYNKLRSNRSLPKINGDTIIDDVTNAIFLDKKYRRSSNEFDEDSIRYLFFNKGVIDYKFETKEILDKDTSNVFNAFLLGDSSSNIRIGYARFGNKQMLIKTKSYLKYDFGEAYVPRINIPTNKNVMKPIKIEIKTDSVVYYVKWIIPGKYYFHYSDHIPLSSESVGIDTIYEIKNSVKKNPFAKEFDDTDPIMALTSIHPDMYLIVTNDKKEIIAILK